MRRARFFLSLLLLLSLCACTTGGSPPASPAPSPSPAPTEAPAPTPEPTPVPTPPPTEAPAPTPTPADGTLSVTADGETVQYPAYTFTGDLNGDGQADFRLLLPLDTATAETLPGTWRFRCDSDPEAACLELRFTVGESMDNLLPGILDPYLSFTEIEFSDASSLGRVRGFVGRVTASDGETLADAWLLDLEDGVLAAVLLRRAEPTGPEGDILSAMLDSFSLQN